MLINIVKHDADSPYICKNCCGVEDVHMSDKQEMWKHLEDYHDWPEHNQDMLSVTQP